MTIKFYKTHTAKFFEGKEGRLLKDIKNKAGEIIFKDEVVELFKRHRGLQINSKIKKADGCVNTITSVNPESVELIKI